MTSHSAPSPRRIPPPAALAAALITGLPPLLLIAFVACLGVDIPYWDQWAFVPMLTKSYVGTVTLHDLWMQHNEHRLLFPRLIMLVLAHLTHWNIRAEMAVIVALALGLFAVLVAQCRETLREFGVPAAALWMSPFSLLVFSFTQWENWLWGWQIQMLLNLLTVTASLFLIARPNSGRIARLLPAVVLGVIASYSFANGLLVWPIGFACLIIVLRRTPTDDAASRRQAVLAASVWAVFGAATIASYLTGYHRNLTPTGAEVPVSRLHRALVSVHYVFNYVGAPLSPTRLAAIFGVVGIAAAFLLVRTLLRSRPNALTTLLPWLALMTYALCSALMTSTGRVQLGAYQAVDSRYTSISSFLWYGIVVMLILAGAQAKRESRRNRSRQFGGALAAIAALVLVASGLGALRAYRGKYEVLSESRRRVLSGNPSDATLHTLYEYPNEVRALMRFLQERHLSVFRDGR